MNALIYRIACFLALGAGISVVANPASTNLLISGLVCFGLAGYGWQKAEDEREQTPEV